MRISESKKAPVARNIEESDTGNSFFPTYDSGGLVSQVCHLQASLLLTCFRKRAKISQKELGERVGVSKTLLAAWEYGAIPIPDDKLGELNKALALSTKDIHVLEKAHKSGSSADEFPILDVQWIAEQPRHLQAGLWLCAFRRRKGLLQRELAGIMRLKSISITHWESGKYRIPRRLFGDLKEALELSNEEARQLGGGMEAYYSMSNSMIEVRRN